MKGFLLLLAVLLLKTSYSQDNSAWQLKETGKNYQIQNQTDSAIYFYNKALNIADNKADTTYSSILYQLSLAHLNKGETQKALEYAMIALEIDNELKDTISIAATLNTVALIYQNSGVFEKALDFQLESIKLSEATNRKEDIANGYYNLGNIYKKFDKANDALGYFEQSKELFTELLSHNANDNRLKRSLSESLYSTGEIHTKYGGYQEALDYFFSALTLKEECNDLYGLSNTFNRIADVYSLQGEIDHALQTLLFKALPLKLQLNDQRGLAIIYSNIGQIHYQRNDFASAKNFLDKSNQYANLVNDLEVLITNAGLLTKIYKSENLLLEAMSFQEMANAYKDSLALNINRKLIEEMSVRFETDKKEQQNKILSLTVERQKTVRNYLVATTLLILVIVVVTYRQYLQKKRTNTIISKKNTLLEEQNIQINSQKKVIEEKNKDLTDSIEYAQKIQESLLSKTEELNTKLKDIFILFKPKDIVSGDFYWTGEKNGKLIISAIDCTGHGVPGAFMSMLGDSYLNQIIYHLGITSPEQILTELDKNIKSALKQEDTNNQDGMDMALCSIDMKTKSIEFAGAKNPLVYIQNGEVHKIKGSRQPIGGSIEKGSGFEKHELKIDTPTSFYMFSDGYQDQFGGPKGKKFMVKKLQNLLVEIHNEPMTKQKEILDNTITEWMNGTEQIDDILVLGFKID